MGSAGPDAVLSPVPRRGTPLLRGWTPVSGTRPLATSLPSSATALPRALPARGLIGLGASGATLETPHLEYLDTYFPYRLSVAITSLSPVKPHLLHLSTLCPHSISLPPHLGHLEEVPLGLTLTTSRFLSLCRTLAMSPSYVQTPQYLARPPRGLPPQGPGRVPVRA